MTKVIGIIAIKGGVGKTTIAASLASNLVNEYHKKVLLVDANFSAPNLGLHMDIIEPQKTIHDVLTGKAKIRGAIHNRYGVDVIPGSYFFEGRINYLRLGRRLRAVKKGYDFIIIDSSPSVNEEMLSTMLAAEHLFVVTTPDYPTLSCSMRAAKLAKQRGKPIDGIVLNKIRDPRYEIGLKEIEEVTGIPVIARIPDDKSNIGALFMRIPTSVYNARGGFAKEISRLGSAVIGKPKKMSFWQRLFSFNFKKEEVNRQILNKSLYKSIFEGRNNEDEREK
jgi:septum site-determining protein MinD